MAMIMIVAPGSPESASQCSVPGRGRDRATRMPLAFLRLLGLFYEVSVQGHVNEKKRHQRRQRFR